MGNKIHKFFVKCFGRENELRERLFRFLLFVGTCVGIISVVESVVLGSDILYVTPLMVFMVWMAGALV